MSPYREARALNPSRARSANPLRWIRPACWLVFAATAGPNLLSREPADLYPFVTTVQQWTWLPYLLPLALVSLILGVLPGPDDDAKARLCRIRWNCGDRGTAFGVYIGWIPLRLSQSRIERNARAVERFVAQRRRERYPWLKG